jgi:hypothetical protein
MFWNISGKSFLFFAILAFLGLMVAIDGVLSGPWYRFLGGLAWFVAWGWLALFGPPKVVRDRIDAVEDQVISEAVAIKRPDGSRSWPFIFVSVVFALVALAGAGFILFAPYQDLLDWSIRSAYLLRELSDVLGEFGSRVPLAAVFLFASYAASKTAWERMK